METSCYRYEPECAPFKPATDVVAIGHAHALRSGTTQAVAMKLGRRFIGADINLGAVQITTKRLISVGKELANAAARPRQPPRWGE